MPYYPTPTANDTTDLLAISQFVNNDLSGGLFFPIMILVVWVVQFIGILSEGRGASRAWIYAGFTSSILAIILGILALTAQKYVYLLVLLVSLGAFWFKIINSSN